MRKIFLLLVVYSLAISAQKNIKNYKYIIIPKQFDFVKSPDKYQTSSLTKFLFNKHGFTAFLNDEEFPEDLANNGCLALKAVVKNESGMFVTKNYIELKNCNNKVIYTSSIGKSKKKDYKKAYHEAIRKAFNSIKQLNYSYVPVVNKTEENSKVISSTQKKQEEPEPVKSDSKVVKKSISLKKEVLYAQPKPNGYQLVNTKPEVVFELLNTNVKDVFIIKNKNGILHKSNATWTAEFYQDGKKISKSYDVKF